jgi:ubiquinone biosynthesis protein
MIKKIYILFKIARKLALSDALKIVSRVHKPPLAIKIFLGIFSISFSERKNEDQKLSDEERLCLSIQNMGTTFIKLGQFVATRPDIISEDLSKQLEKLQDRLPPFPTLEVYPVVFQVALTGLHLLYQVVLPQTVPI